MSKLSKDWMIPPQIAEIYLRKRDDIADMKIKVDEVIFHIPKLEKDNLYVLWDCLWPDCNNCCTVDRLPITKDDIDRLTTTLGYNSKMEFIENETTISSWTHGEPFDPSNTTRTQICLSKGNTKKDEEKVLRCRFADSTGCTIHAKKPGVCKMYPFMSYINYEAEKLRIHAIFQFTGDCPGFYLSPSIEDLLPRLRQYAKKIYSYNMEYLRTVRENYAARATVSVSEDLR